MQRFRRWTSCAESFKPEVKTAPFDQIIAVDWSASTKPKRGADSCWIAQARQGQACVLRNPSTRQLAMAEVEIMIAEALASGERSLIGFDASLGYARGLHAQLGLTGDDSWAKLWAKIAALSSDGPANANNRFSVAQQLNEDIGWGQFWARPQTSGHEHLHQLSATMAGRRQPKQPQSFLDDFRLCERVAGGGIQSSWKLYGAGSVGGQILTLLPYLHRLREQLGSALGVWPFDGWQDPGTSVVLLELWFSHQPISVPLGEVRDAAQVRRSAEGLLALHPSDWDELWFPQAVRELPKAEQEVLRREEGWTFEVGSGLHG